MKPRSSLLIASAILIFLGTTAVALFIAFNFDNIPTGVSAIALLCALVMYKHVFDIVKVLECL